jgi:hypothetical protein
MAIIVEDTRTKAKGILLGAGFGHWQTRGAHWGVEKTDGGITERVAVCNSKGEVMWLAVEFARVVSIDGDRPQDVLIDD